MPHSRARRCHLIRMPFVLCRCIALAAAADLRPVYHSPPSSASSGKEEDKDKAAASPPVPSPPHIPSPSEATTPPSAVEEEQPLQAVDSTERGIEVNNGQKVGVVAVRSPRRTWWGSLSSYTGRCRSTSVSSYTDHYARLDLV